MTKEKVYRGDIFLADLNSVKGSEQGGKRPVIIIQTDVGNRHSPTVIVAAVTSRFLKKKSLPTHVLLESCVLEKNSQALLEQIGTIDRCRLISKVGRVTEENMMEIEKALMVSLALSS